MHERSRPARSNVHECDRVSTQRLRSVVFPLLLAAVAVSCVRRADLTPGPQARRAGTETAVTHVDGVAFELRSDAWSGLESVVDHITPVRVKLTNESDRPIRLRYSDFALIAPEGRRYAALPPFGVTGTVQEPRLVRAYSPVTRPYFLHHRFDVAPYYGALYPHLAPDVGVYHYDPFYHGAYYHYWVEIPLPTRGMLEWALPEGVIRPGGHVEGFFYFERVDPEEPYVVFRADLVTDDGQRFGEVRIPFNVEPKAQRTARS